MPFLSILSMLVLSHEMPVLVPLITIPWTQAAERAARSSPNPKRQESDSGTRRRLMRIALIHITTFALSLMAPYHAQKPSGPPLPFSLFSHRIRP